MFLPLRPLRGWLPLLLAGPCALSPIAVAGAAPAPDLSRYPEPALGERRWLVQLPESVAPSRDPALSASPEDWRVQLIAGRQIEVDCNRYLFSGRLRSQPVAGSDLRVVRISEVTPVASTRMACPEGQPKRQAFVPMGGKPFVMPFDPKRPIVIYAPRDLELRWRLWRAERRQWPAQER
ncbi:MAG: ecotin family protein [Cyanobium sp.]